MTKQSRRNFLKMLGKGAAVLPALPAIAKEAVADEQPEPPKQAEFLGPDFYVPIYSLTTGTSSSEQMLPVPMGASAIVPHNVAEFPWRI
jgi:hypothetical protein